jgi:hypothetical protein
MQEGEVNMPTHRFYVNYWEGHPENENSKPIACSGFDDPNEAMRAFMKVPTKHNPTHIEVCGFSGDALRKLGWSEDGVRGNFHYNPSRSCAVKLPHNTTRCGLAN